PPPPTPSFSLSLHDALPICLWSFSRRILSSWPEGSVLVTPTLTRLPATVGGLQSQAGVTDDAVRFSTLVRMWGVTGQPAISLPRSEEHTSELQSRENLVCRL